MRSLRRSTWTLVVVLVVGLFWSACSDQRSDLAAPDEQLDAPLISVVSPQALAPVILVQERHTRQLLDVPGVVGTAVGVTSDGRPAVKILATEAVGAVPDELDGFPVEVMITGKFFALPAQADPRAKPTCGKRGLPPCPNPTMRLPRPVPIGVSTGHPAITAGTLGARVKDAAGNLFALSNNHVYADENQANTGDAVIQPGTFDGGMSPADDIGTLADFEPIDFTPCPIGNNTIDAAIAATTAALVGNSTLSEGYGTPQSQTMTAAVNMKVKKYGRTTRQTTGTVSAINATVNVGYSTGVACFTGQIVITPGSFSAGGDSGSLIVVDAKGRNKNDNRKPIGLLFAGSSTQTIANPIDAVLTRFVVTIDGN
jgi:hypothetical protein